MPKLDAIWTRYAEPAGLTARRPSFRFDPVYYHSRHPSLPEAPQALAEHFRSAGAAAGLFPTYYQELRNHDPAIDTGLRDLVIDPELRRLMLEDSPGAHELAFELIHLGAPIDAEMSDFSMKAYLEWNPDVGRARVDPLMHYLCHGRNEIGRRTLADLRKSHFLGQRAFRPDCPTCLIAVHEMSQTGAPIVGLDLAREASSTHNVVVAALRAGPLLDRFRELSCDVVITDQPHEHFAYFGGEALSRVDFAILNSVESYPFVPWAVAREIPFLSYVHEYADYTFPAFKSAHMALFADLLVFSSEHVRCSWMGRLHDVDFDVGRDSMILPQRQLVSAAVIAEDVSSARARLSRLIGRPLADNRVICGAGHLQWRKGTDIFAMAAQICRNRDPDTVFIWIGDGLNAEDIGFGVWMDYHLRQIDANRPDGNLFLLPAGPAYPDVLMASDAMFLSSRIDPLPNVVFDALAKGCHVLLFEGGSGFADAMYESSPDLTKVEYGNPDAAAKALLGLPRKATTESAHTAADVGASLSAFDSLRRGLQARLDGQKLFIRGASDLDLPVLFSTKDSDRTYRIREREKMMRYRRRMIWRDLGEARSALRTSESWIHRRCRLLPYAGVREADLPSFAIHVHAYYTDDLASDLRNRRAYRHARRIVVTTDTEKKADTIEQIMRGEGLRAELLLVPNRGRDILPFMELFGPGGTGGREEIWCHVHQKRSIGSASHGDPWRRFLMRILLGDAHEISEAVMRIADPGVGLVAPFDPHHVPWNASRALLPRFENRLPGPLPKNPLVFPVGNMFWIRRSVVEAMNALFGPDYPWPNEPIANDGTEFHLIERLWPALAASCGLDAVFLHKLDERRV